jgi:integrase
VTVAAEVVEGVIIRPMITIDDAVDLWLGHLARKGRKPRTRDNYRRILDKFADRFPRQWDVAKVDQAACEGFLDLWSNHADGTRGQAYAPLAGMFRWLHHSRRIKTNPMEFVPAPRRSRPEDLDVVTVSPLDVPLILQAAETWPERVCVSILAYLGPRRRALALLRLRDYDRRTGEIRFHEKGGKTIWKPCPTELAQVLDAAIGGGAIRQPDDYLVPPEGPLSRAGDRDDRVIWRLVKKVAERAGVEAHVHALRGAFACFYLLNNRGDVYGLGELLGHRSLETTKVYLRRFERRVAMERVRSLSWTGNNGTAGLPQTAGMPFASSAGMGAGGFEPPLAGSPLVGREGTQPREESLDGALLSQVKSDAERRVRR